MSIRLQSMIFNNHLYFVSTEDKHILVFITERPSSLKGSVVPLDHHSVASVHTKNLIPEFHTRSLQVDQRENHSADPTQFNQPNDFQPQTCLHQSRQYRMYAAHTINFDDYTVHSSDII